MDNDLLMCIYQICNIIIHLFTPLIPPLPNPTRPINQSIFSWFNTSSQCPPCVSLNHIPFHLPEHKTTPSFYLLLLLHLTNWFCVFFFFSCVPPYLAHHLLFSFFASLPPSHSNATQPLYCAGRIKSIPPESPTTFLLLLIQRQRLDSIFSSSPFAPRRNRK